jgi:hypothetical protein
MSSKKQLVEEYGFTAAEQRAARAERVSVTEAEPYGWIAVSESGKETYILYSSPYIYRGKDDSAYECKHISAVLKYIGRWYLVHDYDPLRQICKSA